MWGMGIMADQLSQINDLLRQGKLDQLKGIFSGIDLNRYNLTDRASLVNARERYLRKVLEQRMKTITEVQNRLNINAHLKDQLIDEKDKEIEHLKKLLNEERRKIRTLPQTGRVNELEEQLEQVKQEKEAAIKVKEREVQESLEAMQQIRAGQVETTTETQELKNELEFQSMSKKVAVGQQVKLYEDLLARLDQL